MCRANRRWQDISQREVWLLAFEPCHHRLKLDQDRGWPMSHAPVKICCPIFHCLLTFSLSWPAPYSLQQLATRLVLIMVLLVFRFWISSSWFSSYSWFLVGVRTSCLGCIKIVKQIWHCTQVTKVKGSLVHGGGKTTQLPCLCWRYSTTKRWLHSGYLPSSPECTYLDLLNWRLAVCWWALFRERCPLSLWSSFTASWINERTELCFWSKHVTIASTQLLNVS